MSTVKEPKWVKEFPGSITVCDARGTILALNNRAAEVLRNDGGRKLLGSNLLSCHPEPARTKLKQLMKARLTNVYTVKKGRQRKIVIQSPWYSKKRYSGFVEITLEIHGRIPNIVRRV